MKKLLIIGTILFSINFAYAQTELKATMGINFKVFPLYKITLTKATSQVYN